MNCIKCGEALPDNAKFCCFCGVRQELTCASCGAVLPNNALFCYMCGSPIETAADPEPPTDDFDPNLLNDDFFASLPRLNFGTPSDTPVSERPDTPPSAPPQPKRAPEMPNAQNFAERFQVKGRRGLGKPAQNPCTLEVELRFNDNYREDTDPDYFCYASLSIVHKDTDEVAYGLEDLLAYALSDAGIYYAQQDGTIMFLGTGGTVEVLGRKEHITHMEYANGVLDIIFVKERRQTAWDEHRDLCGYMYEAWYDVYQVTMGRAIARHTPSGG